MKPDPDSPDPRKIECACSLSEGDGEATPAVAAKERGVGFPELFSVGVLSLVLWWMVYKRLALLSNAITYKLFSLEPGSRLASSVEFFLYDTPKVLMLLAL
ncbi:MAG TPA: hypothetical protein VIU29_05445, partial [Candidatus Deferrimicrobiaceae bacterium]